MRKFCKLPQRYVSAFTLAEMMVVMLIMSIILAAMAPVMTTRSKADSSSPWRYSPENLSDAYFGAGESQIAMIGQPNKLETDDAARLILTSSSSLPVHLSFKRDNTTLGRLQFIDTNLVLGSGSLDHLNGGGNNISIGPNNLTQVTSGGSNIAIGDNAMLSTTSGGNNIGIGTTLTGNIDGSNNVAVGDDSLTKANSSWNTVVGRNAYQLGTGGSNTIVGGDAMSEGSGSNNVAVGTNSLWYGSGDGNVAIGANSNYKNQTLTTFTNSTAVGFSSYASGTGSVAVGANSSTLNAKAIAIGNATAIADSSISIGEKTTSSDENAIAMGTSSISSGDGSLSLGSWSEATGYRSVAVGPSAESSSYASVALGSESGASANYSISIGEFSRATEHAAVAIGDQAKAQGSQSVAIGQNSKVNGGNHSAALGYSADASGHSAVAIGNNAKAVNNYNIAIGANACQYVTGTNKTCIGANSGPASTAFEASDDVERIFIGSAPKVLPDIRASEDAGIGRNAIVEIVNSSDASKWGSEKGGRRHGYPNGPTVYINGNLVIRGYTWLMVADDRGDEHDEQGLVSSNKPTGDGHNIKWNRNAQKYPTVSDRRLKYLGKEYNLGLDKIRQLKVFNYTLKKDETKTPHVGVIAQDLQKIFPDAVKKGTDGFLSIRFEDMFYAMINAIKELDLKYEAQQKRINELEARIEKLEAKLK